MTNCCSHISFPQVLNWRDGKCAEKQYHRDRKIRVFEKALKQTVRSEQNLTLDNKLERTDPLGNNI